MRAWQSFVLLGALNGFCAVALGAFGAHGLEGVLAPDLLRAWNKAVDYQQFHALGLVLIGLLLHREDRRPWRLAGWCLLFGIIFFSGSLYLLALSGIRPIGAVTPFGGVAFLLGWAFLASGAFRSAADVPRGNGNRRKRPMPSAKDGEDS